jgi:hypothetical protein
MQGSNYFKQDSAYSLVRPRKYLSPCKSEMSEQWGGDLPIWAMEASRRSRVYWIPRILVVLDDEESIWD